jgi:hypothetical protein
MTMITLNRKALIDFRITKDTIELDGVMVEDILTQLIENFEDDDTFTPLVHALKLALHFRRNGTEGFGDVEKVLRKVVDEIEQGGSDE